MVTLKGITKKISDEFVLKKIDTTRLPSHIAIIMDGNGRWAKKRHLPRTFGHKAGVKSVRSSVEACAELGIKVLTLYTFSTENWSRPEQEVSMLMSLLKVYLKKELSTMMKNNIKLLTIGQIDRLPESASQLLASVIQKTSQNTGMKLVLALNYGAREEITQAVRGIINDGCAAAEVNEKLISNYLYTKNLPDPELLIRTSGEMRISNFLLWQIAYTELVVTDVLWPDFSKTHLFEAISEYQTRERRFGGI